MDLECVVDDDAYILALQVAWFNHRDDQNLLRMVADFPKDKKNKSNTKIITLSNQKVNEQKNFYQVQILSTTLSVFSMFALYDVTSIKVEEAGEGWQVSMAIKYVGDM